MHEKREIWGSPNVNDFPERTYKRVSAAMMNSVVCRVVRATQRRAEDPTSCSTSTEASPSDSTMACHRKAARARISQAAMYSVAFLAGVSRRLVKPKAVRGSRLLRGCGGMKGMRCEMIT